MLMDELKVDFAIKRGNEMIVDLESGITRERLDPLEIQMLQRQRIPMLLPVEWLEMDGQITFRYLFTGKRILMHRLQTQQLSMMEFYTLLLAIVETLDDCRHYMLRAENFLLHEQYIFAGDSWEHISLVYVPLRGERMVASAGEAVLAMAVRFVGAIDQPNGAGLQRVFQHLRDEYVSWTSLRQTLLSLLGDGYRAERTGPSPVIDFDAVRTQQSKAVEDSAEREPLNFRDETPARPARFNLSEEPERDAIMADQLPESQQAEATVSRTKWIIGALFMLVNGLIWRYLYMAAPSRTSLLMSSGLSLMSIAALLVFRQKRNSHASNEEAGWTSHQKQSEWQEEDDFTPDSRLLSKLTYKSSTQLHLANIETAVSKTDESQLWDRATPNDATVLLGSSQSAKGGAEATDGCSSWLERQTGERTEQIKLEQQHFVIGRSAEGAQYADSSYGISRAHLEFINSKGNWSAKDMGSRNGSMLNGNTMIPYKPYALTDKDLIQLAGEKGPKYIFRTHST
ncbi:pSer/pThr/pTyr-binding forkhead associated (FHA) protein [Paenibacillus taihuensis]|uniref:PSer/pThr/pTyr-binding forkhead associated (FHA) protein n=1 Tax=Paenibacillus taihuensis TaxID=1156355 RepID=A0A3D9R0B2_9BACL|nr:DUF6382 domain-containing protein [Paenibacillus taihuensis]REE67262.1 pSer/pThr/pTyr-binding forkhead associated (FHA) protein [Paenibacillus taihuensis]